MQNEAKTAPDRRKPLPGTELRRSSLPEPLMTTFSLDQYRRRTAATTTIASKAGTTISMM